MKKSIAAIAALALVAGQVSIASAATKDDARLIKTSVPSCATPLQASKVAKHVRVENRCQAEATEAGGSGGLFGVGIVPVVFAGAIIAGVVAVAVVTTNNNSATSP